METFSLFSRPNRLVFLDDDAGFIEALNMSLPRTWRADLFLRPSACLAYLLKNAKAWEQDFWRQQNIVNRALTEHNIIPLTIQYWHECPERYDLVQLAAFDYEMPSMTGLEVFMALKNWLGHKILLTGQADQATAVKAFNQGLINLFIPKQTDGLRLYLQEHLQPMLDKALHSHQSIWSHGLTPEQQTSLEDESVASALSALIRQNKWIEYVITPMPFGVLGMTANGAIGWIQIEKHETLLELSEIAISEGLERTAAKAVVAAQQLVNVELRLALQQGDIPTSTVLPLQLSPAINLGGGFLAAHHELPAHYSLPLPYCYNTWAIENSNRVCLD